jgi:4-amino-4-deoxy-L-arabinose transferase-like glycosyltransferase
VTEASTSSPQTSPACRWLEGKRAVWGAVLVYAALGLAVLPFCRYKANPDGYCYISIARYYLEGDFGKAINGYWGPLYSWLMVPLLGLGVENLLAARLVLFLAGAGIFPATYLLGKGLGLGPRTLIWTLAALELPVLGWAASWLTPDLILSVLILFYLALVIRPSTAHPWRTSIGCGLLGGVAFWAKGYAMPFFLAHYAITMVLLDAPSGSPPLRWRAGRILVGGVVFLALALPWGAALSRKYHKPTMGETGRYNLSIFGRGPRGSKGHPMHWQGYLTPSHEKALSAWEDPCLFTVPRWSPFQSVRDFLSLAKHSLGTGWWAVKLLFDFWILALPVLILSVADVLRRPRGRPREVAVVVLAFGLWVGGYCMFLVETRYLIPGLVVLALLGARLMERWDISKTRPVASKAIWVAAAVALAWSPLRDLYRERNEGHWEFQQANSLRNVVPAGSRLASDTKWHASLSLAYHLGAHYYGEAAPNWTSKEIGDSLDGHRVDVFFLWEKADGDAPPSFLRGARCVAHVDRGPDVYQLKE